MNCGFNGSFRFHLRVGEERTLKSCITKHRSHNLFEVANL